MSDEPQKSNETPSNQSQAEVSEGSRSSVRSGFWSGRFIITIAVLLLIALIAAYLQYVYYASLLPNPPFYESNVTLHLGFFSYAYDAIKCVPPDSNQTPIPVTDCLAEGGTFETITGVPAFDFFQFFFALFILTNILHVIQRRNK
jgi:hypothetical protein